MLRLANVSNIILDTPHRFKVGKSWYIENLNKKYLKNQETAIEVVLLLSWEREWGEGETALTERTINI